MALRSGMLNLQEVVRELDRRISALEAVKAKEVADAEPKTEAGSAPEPPKAD